MKIIITDDAMDVQPDVMLFSKERMAEILEYLQSGISINRDAAEHYVERSEPGLTVTEDDPSELDVVYCSDCGTQEAYANGLCADCLVGTPHPGHTD